MIKYGQKLTAFGSTEIFIKAASGYIFTHKKGVIKKIDPNRHPVIFKNFRIICRGSYIGVKFKDVQLYASEHAVNRAMSKNLIKSNETFPNLIFSCLQDKELETVYKNGYKKIKEILNYHSNAKFLISKNNNIVMVVKDNVIVTVYEYFGSIFYKKPEYSNHRFKCFSRRSTLLENGF